MNSPAIVRAISAIAASALLSAHTLAQPSSQSVSPASLREALVAFSHDSLGGRLAGSKGAEKSALFIEQSLTRMRVRPAGDQGKFTQLVPTVRIQIDSGETVMTGGRLLLTYGVDYQPVLAFGGLRSANRVEGNSAVFGGRLGGPNAISPATTAGKLVVLLPPLRPNGQPDYQVWSRPDLLTPYSLSRALLIVSLELMPASVRRALDRPFFAIKDQPQPRRSLPPVVAVSRASASLMLRVGAEAADVERAATAARGSVPKAIVTDAELRAVMSQRAPDAPMRNIIAVIEGSHPALKREYVVVSARLDQADIVDFEPDMVSVWPIDRDSIGNGADAGSGAIALLQLARQMSETEVKPRRSVVFLWTVGQQHGHLGADWFVERTSIPRGQIVASLHVDMIGRRHSTDTSATGSGYLRIAGAGLGSSQFAVWVDDVNRNRFSFSIDTADAAGSRATQNYCIGDGWSFAKHGIPSVLVTTARDGEHGAGHDTISEIDFEKLARVTEFVGALATDIANRPTRPGADKRKPDPRASCLQ